MSRKQYDPDLFRLDPDTALFGTRRVGGFSCSPSCLVDLFGKPAEADGEKISGIYVFVSADGEVFTIYDWKKTSLYLGSDGDCPTPREFWEADEVQELEIGGTGRTSPDVFINWLIQRWERHKAEVRTPIDRN